MLFVFLFRLQQVMLFVFFFRCYFNLPVAAPNMPVALNSISVTLFDILFSALLRFSFPVSSEISDLCQISDPLLFVSYFASQSKIIKFDDYCFDVRCVN